MTREQVQENTGFTLVFDSDIGVTEPPTDAGALGAARLDPERLYTA